MRYDLSMQILPYSDEALAKACEILTRGGCVAHATETCYGLACDLSDPEAVTNLFGVKQRPLTHPLSALFFDVAHAKQYVEWNTEAQAIADASLPGPVTVILPLREDALRQLFPLPEGHPTIGVRISPHPAAQALLKKFGSPISTTSANLHGQPTPYSAEELADQFAESTLQPDLILDSGELPRVSPSKIIDLTAGGKILRS